jgi:hypothetical protein
MDPAVVGDDLRGHRKDPGVPGLGQDVYPDTGQHAVRRNETVVDTVHAGHESPHAGQVHPRHRGASENAGTFAGSDESSKGLCRQHHVSIEIDPGVRPARRVAHRDRMRLSVYRCLDDAYVERPGDRRGVVTARIRHHDHVELARTAVLQKPLQVRCDDRGLVVGRDHHARRRAVRIPDRGRILVHSDLPVASRRTTLGAPPDRITAAGAADRLERPSLRAIPNLAPTVVRRPTGRLS